MLLEDLVSEDYIDIVKVFQQSIDIPTATNLIGKLIFVFI
jgi:hypothetical protein